MGEAFTDSRGRRWEPDPTGRYPYRGRTQKGTWTDYVIHGPGDEPVQDLKGGLEIRGKTPWSGAQRFGMVLLLVGILAAGLAFTQQQDAATDLRLSEIDARYGNAGDKLIYLSTRDSLESRKTTWTVATGVALVGAVAGLGMIFAFRRDE